MRLSTPCLVAAAALAALPARAADPIFNQSLLHETRIVMDPADWSALRENFRENQYYAANISIDGEVVLQVGIRSRGAGSRSGEKPGLKVDFNKYAKTQEFHGYKTLVIDNLVQDPSLVRERLAFAVFEAMGLPAPQISHTRLTVNDQYWGVYTLVEPISKPFLKSRLGQESGNLFDYEYIDHWNFTVRGDAAAYVPLPFDPETNEDSLDTSALLNFVRAVNEAPDSAFLPELGNFLDVPRFITYLAVENALAEFDGFVGQFGVNNFFLYQLGGGSRFVFIPWDKESNLFSTDWPLFQRVEENVLTRRLLSLPDQRKLYVDAVRKAAQFVNSRWLTPKLEQAYAQIREAALADTHKQVSNQEFELAIGGLRTVIEGREADILAKTAAAQ